MKNDDGSEAREEYAAHDRRVDRDFLAKQIYAAIVAQNPRAPLEALTHYWSVANVAAAVTETAPQPLAPRRLSSRGAVLEAPLHVPEVPNPQQAAVASRAPVPPGVSVPGAGFAMAKNAGGLGPAPVKESDDGDEPNRLED